MLGRTTAVFTVAALGLFTFTGCQGSFGAPANPSDQDGSGDGSGQPGDGQGGGGGDGASSDGEGGSGCDLQAIMARPENGCTNAGCHGAQFQGGLDLASPGLAGRLMGAVSQTDACGGQPLVDPEHPDQSLLLRLIDPVRFENSPCGVMMPLGSSEGVDAETLSCFESFIAGLDGGAGDGTSDPPPSFEATAPISYVNKVKTLLTGLPATSSEVAQVVADQDALRTLIATWVETPQFEEKLRDFLMVALQQRLVGSLNTQFMQLRGNKVNALGRALEESFVRTAMDIVAEGRSFGEIATTRRWTLSTAGIAALAFLEKTANALRAEKHTLIAGAGENSVTNRVWHVPGVPGTCTLISPVPAAQVMELMLGFADCTGAGAYRFDDTILTDADFTDFRPVDLARAANADEVPLFYDVATLRGLTRLPLQQPRMGFFTTPTFLANWETNEDNQFRVTTSQTLIVALGAIFSPADPTVPVRLDGLAEEHATPGSTCYGCHQFLDPMREYFARNFSFTYQRAQTLGTITPSFAFRGVVHDGGGLDVFARTLAEHPDFAVGWTQKLCYWANSQACDESDPEFQRVVAAFTASGGKFKSLLVELFSSPLVTAAAETQTYAEREPFVSITRKQHLCQLLSVRLGVDDACQVAQNFAGLVPEDDFSRGSAEPVQASVTGLFHFAAAEKLCLRLATKLVGTAAGVRFPSSEPDAALESFAGELMGLDAGHPRGAAVRARLRAHFDSAKAATNQLTALRSTFTVACMSPEVMAVGL